MVRFLASTYGGILGKGKRSIRSQNKKWITIPEMYNVNMHNYTVNVKLKYAEQRVCSSAVVRPSVHS